MDYRSLDEALDILNESNCKGYTTAEGYMGYDPEERKYRLFATEEEYREWYRENIED